jgi:hypothetical protein
MAHDNLYSRRYVTDDCPFKIHFAKEEICLLLVWVKTYIQGVHFGFSSTFPL